MMGAWDSIMKGFLTSWLDAGMMVSLEGESMTWLTDQLRVLGADHPHTLTTRNNLAYCRGTPGMPPAPKPKCAPI